MWISFLREALSPMMDRRLKSEIAQRELSDLGRRSLAP
jgi:hypothetical protein